MEHSGGSWWLVAPVAGVVLPLLHVAVTVSTGGSPLAADELVEPLVLVGIAALLFLGGLLARRNPSVEATRYAGLGTVAGGVAITAVAVPMLAGDGIRSVADVAHGLVVAFAIGAVAGVYVGRARGQTVAATRTLAGQRDAFVFLNRMLRHHVLNGINVIDGHATLIADGDDLTAADHARTIGRRSETIATLVGEIRSVSETLTGDATPVPVDVVALLRKEVDMLREEHPDAVVEFETPERAVAYGGSFLAVVFEHLLTNAVVHNDSDPPRMWVSVRTRGAVEIEVRDDGPGIDTDAPFEPSGGEERGFGLYLVNALVTATGGDIDVASDDEGTTFTVRLPTA